MQENCNINNDQNRDHWIMQIKGFDRLTKRPWSMSHYTMHAREIATIKLSSAGCSCKAKSARSIKIFLLFLIKQLFHSCLLDKRWLKPKRRVLIQRALMEQLVHKRALDTRR